MSTNSRKRRRDSQTKQQKRMKMSSNSNGVKSSSTKPSSHYSNYSNGHTNNSNTNNYYENNASNNKIMCKLSESEISSFTSDNKCSIFSSYIYHTNCRSLYNILLLEYNLEFENIKCCHTNCNIINDGKFYICLHCIYYCCSSHNSGEHLLYHSKTTKHYLYFELASQQIYCMLCGTYHSSLWSDELIISFVKLSKKRLLNNNNEIECAELEMKLIPTGNIWKSFDSIRDNGMLGIRGMYNLGNTCYMTVLLQIFMHNKLLINYYLSSYHSYKCKETNNNKCIGCQLELLFIDFYCGINYSSASISDFIGCIWKEETYNLVGQDMHDCHEFFISLTSLMHKFEHNNAGYNKNELECQCIIHKTFRGLWCSELKCLNNKCKYVSQTTDMFMEINLQPRKLQKNNNNNKNNRNNKTIEEALKDYMESEPMPDYKCQQCKMKGMCSKFMSIKELPQTLCLHLKRFEADELVKELSQSANPLMNGNLNTNINTNKKQKSPSVKSMNSYKSNSRSLSPNVTKNNRSRRNKYKYEYNNINNSNNNLNNNNNSMSNSNILNSNESNSSLTNAFDKIDEFVQFPVDELLDLSQFVNVNYKNKKVNNKRYKLKSMIIHSGVLSSGHYVCYIRKDNNWYYCDDNNIVSSSSHYVKSQNAYMLFYEAQ